METVVQLMGDPSLAGETVRMKIGHAEPIVAEIVEAVQIVTMIDVQGGIGKKLLVFVEYCVSNEVAGEVIEAEAIICSESFDVCERNCLVLPGADGPELCSCILIPAVIEGCAATVAIVARSKC